MKKTKVVIIVMVLAIIAGIVFIGVKNSKEIELVSIKNKNQLKNIYEGEETSFFKTIGLGLLTMPYSIISGWDFSDMYYSYDGVYTDSITNSSIIAPDSIGTSMDAAVGTTEGISSTLGSSSSKDYSTTNIQVENVDEADITKTDGDYIYSISENKVIITDVKDPKNIKIVATIEAGNSSTVIPEELMLYNNKLTVIYTETPYSNSYYYNNKNNTIVKVYDIQNKERPKLVKEYTLYSPYYTSRCIENKLYVISSGNLREENDEIITYYKENKKQKELDLNKIKYLKDNITNKQTLISMIDLENVSKDVSINSYLMNIKNAYVSENNIYLLNQTYNGDVPELASVFGLKGIFGAFDDKYYDRQYVTEIYKFNILDDGSIKYDKKAEEKGRTINQFSLDEYNENLRVAMYDDDGSRIVVFDKNLQKIGQTEDLAKGENMYSSRFLGEKAYLVTYKTVDPLYVIDLSNPSNPEVLGELKIPGYSTYLHPYDEDHLIGIGMQTEEIINRNSSGKVISTTARITGMKMALFDVSDVNHPVQISDTIIGDSRATSAILTNHKALLFSKEKELIAIPVNNYAEDFEITTSSEDHSRILNSYKNYNKEYISEGYFVYNINLEDGFELKGVINHDKTASRYSYYNTSKLLRGMYIEDNLFTVSENAIKVNRLDNLNLISELKIGGE